MKTSTGHSTPPVFSFSLLHNYWSSNKGTQICCCQYFVNFISAPNFTRNIHNINESVVTNSRDNYTHSQILLWTGEYCFPWLCSFHWNELQTNTHFSEGGLLTDISNDIGGCFSSYVMTALYDWIVLCVIYRIYYLCSGFPYKREFHHRVNKT